MFLRKITYLFVTFMILISSSLLYANSLQHQVRGSQKYAADRILVKLSDDVIDQVSFDNKKQVDIEAIDQLNELFKIKTITKAYIEVNNKQMEEQLGIARWFIFKYEEDIDIENIVSQLKELPVIEEAIPDYIAHPATVPNDPMYSSQWGHNNTSQLLSYNSGTGSHTGPPVGTVGFDTNAEVGWNGSQGYGSSSVIIAIIDSGVDAGHADLNQVTGYDFGDNDSNPDDNSASPGHGTACSGIAAGIANNNLGVAGIAGGCSIMPLKVADSAGNMYFSAVDNALYYAANNGADIVSLSLGASINPSVVPNTEAALQYALNAGVIIFAATANANNSSIDYPANSQYAISVGAASPDDGRKRSSSDANGVTVDNEYWWGSNYGSTTQDARDAVDVIAPTILPTTDITGSSGYSSGDYSMWFNGTSCSTPYAAGVAALIKSQNPSWTPAQIRTQLINTAIDIVNVESATGWDRYSGYGMVDAGAALFNPSITVTAPNGGENWDLGSSHNITWTSQDVTNVDIDLYNSGTYVYTIIGSYPASSGSFTWPIPSGLPAATTYSIKISDSSASTTYDDSDAYFTLNDPGTPIPVIDVTPLSFTATVEVDEIDTQQMHITNIGDPGSTLNYSISHGFTDGDNISDSYVACSPGSYTPGETTNWTFSVYNASTDAEWLSDVYVTFPPGVTVNSGTNFIGGNGPLTYDGSTGNGVTIHWYDADGGWGNIYGGQTATSTVNVTISPSLSGNISLAYQIDGDIYGSLPHTVTGSIMLLHETWLSYSPTSGSCAYGVTDDIDVTFDATGLPIGTYTADIIVTNNGGGPVTVPCTLNVIFPPDIDVSTSSFSENLYTNETSTQWLTVGNIGGEQLDFTIVSNPVVSWLSLRNSSGSVAPLGGTMVIGVDFDTASIPHGNYITDIVIDCNDPSEPQVTIPVTLTVHNDAPTISLPDDFTYAEDAGLVVDFSLYVNDLDNDPLTLNVSGNTNVTVSINGLEVTFGNTQDWNGTEILMFVVNDGQTDATAADMVDIIVTPVNDPPILNITGTLEADEDLPSVIYDFSGFCSQTWGETDVLTLIADNSTHIDVTVTDFDVVFESNTLNWNGTESVTFYLNDNVSDSGRALTSQTISVTINPVNDAPTIVLPSQFNVDEDVSTTFDFTPFINDVDGDVLTIIPSGNTNITVNVIDYDVTFGNVLNWYGMETLTFIVEDGASDAMAVDMADVVVDPVNDPPILNIAGTFEAEEDLPSVVYDFSGFCSQTWGETDVLTLTADNSTHIDVTITDFDVVFESNTLNWNGSEDITVYLDDNVADSRDIVSQIIQVTINPVNDAPTIILPDDFTFDEDGSLVEDFAAYIDDVDPDNLTLTVTGNTEITVDIVGTIVTFGATENWFGTEILTFTVNDNVTDATAEDDVNVIVTPVNDPPILNITGTFEAEEDLPSVVYDFSGFCSQTWGETDALTLTADNSTHIDVTITDFDVIFESNTLNWNGTEDITIYLNDNVTDRRDIVSQVIQVTINPVNDAPTIILPDDFTFEEDGSLVEDFAAYIDDVDPDDLTLSVTGNTEITVDIVGTIVTFGATENWNGTETLTFIVNDNATDVTAEDDVDVIVTPVNDEPVLIGFTPEELVFTVLQDSVVTFTVIAEDIDSDLTYEWLVDDELQTEITEEFIYQFLDLGVIEIKSVVSDEEYSLETIWNVTVDPATGTGEIIPVETTLYQNHPNPFNPTTNIRFSTTKAGNISINIYNIKGEKIKTLVNGAYPIGEHNVVWNGKDNNGKTVSSGVYFYHMLSKEYSSTKKMILMK